MAVLYGINTERAVLSRRKGSEELERRTSSKGRVFGWAKVGAQGTGRAGLVGFPRQVRQDPPYHTRCLLISGQSFLHCGGI